MLKESLIENNSILLNQRAADWKEAIKLGTDLLEKSGAIEPRYYTSIIENIEKMGPYIILAPGLAMPHSRPEEGVIKTSFALVTLAEPITFDGEDEPISVLVTLADSDTGVDLAKILRCQTKEDVYAVIDQALAG